MADQGDPANVAALMAQLWEQARPVVVERIGVLRAAGETAGTGALGAEAREEARGEAHKLAGLLGTYGLTRGTEIARDAEGRLEGDGPVNGAAITAIAAELRELVEGYTP